LIKKYFGIFIVACVVGTPALAQSKFGIEELISSLSHPAMWRALGTIKPGVEDGAPHDIYRNSAMIAAVVHSTGVNVPYVKLTDDPSLAPAALVAYLGRVEQDKNFTPSDESCGVGVSHLYAIIFDQLLRVKGPQWVEPGITQDKAQEVSSKALSGTIPVQETLAKLCGGSKYRELNAAFASVLKRVDGEMPYLLGEGLRMNQVSDNNRMQASNQLAQQSMRIDESHRKGAEMVSALKGMSPPVTKDPFDHCIGIANDSNSILKDQCIGHVMDAVVQDHRRLLAASLLGVSADRAKDIKSRDEVLGLADYDICHRPEMNRLANDKSGAPVKDETEAENFNRCRYLRIKQRDISMINSPPLTDAQLATEELSHANEIAPDVQRATTLPGELQHDYLAALDRASTLGSMQAKIKLAMFKSQNLDDIKSLSEAENLLNQIDKAQASTTESIGLRAKITPSLQAWRIANSPMQKRKNLRKSVGQGTDDAQRAALAMDDMSRSGGTCDSLVVQAYNVASDTSIAENVRMMVITEKLLITASRISCIR
jgi:hypothetical protein